MYEERIGIRGVAVLLLLTAYMSACTNTDLTPPTLSISSPAPNSPVSGTVAVLVNAVDDMGISSVDLYVRGKSSDSKGVFINSAVGTSPFVINWNSSANMPNQIDLELIAVAKDSSGNESSSPPINVKTQNTATPTLQLITAYNFAEDPKLQTAQLGLLSDAMGSQLPAGLTGVFLESEISPPLRSDEWIVMRKTKRTIRYLLPTTHFPTKLVA